MEEKTYKTYRQQLAKLRKTRRNKTMIKVLFVCHGRTMKSFINQGIMGQNGA